MYEMYKIIDDAAGNNAIDMLLKCVKLACWRRKRKQLSGLLAGDTNMLLSSSGLNQRQLTLVGRYEHF